MKACFVTRRSDPVTPASSIAAEGFESCPMEGFDEIRVKKELKLPAGAEINMIIGVGKGTEQGVWGPRFRVPYEEVVFER